MNLGLSVSRIIALTINLTPNLAQFLNLNTAMIIGDSEIIDTASRSRSYSSLTAVGADFGNTAPEYLAAAALFGQSPQPLQLYIGRWASGTTAGRLLGSALSASQQLLSNFTGITNGGFTITLNALSPVSVTGINLSSATSMAAVAALVNTALTGVPTVGRCLWNANFNRFELFTTSHGSFAKVMPLTAPGSGADISGLLELTAAAGAIEVDGLAGETALTAVTIIDQMSTYSYGYTFGSTVALADADHLAIAGYVEAAAKPHMYGVSTQEAGVPSASSTTDIAYILKAAAYNRSFVEYSSSSPYGAASVFGRMVTVDFTGTNTTITLMFKQLPGIVSETLNDTQANAMDAKNCNYFAAFQNGTSILVNGKCSSGAYIDEIFGVDWLANTCQTNMYNQLLLFPKIPQTDAGMNVLVSACEAGCAQGRTNGLIAPGAWTNQGFGALNFNDYMPTGFYVYAAPIALQAPSDRQARKATSIQIGVKLAGAIHTASAIINVNV